MAEQSKTTSWRVLMWAALADVGIGIVLAVAALVGVLGEDLEIVALAGAVVALTGVGLFIWARKNLNDAENRRGDLN